MATWSVRLGEALTPPRHRGTEVLDAPDVSWELRQRSHRDIALSNTLLGGSRAIAAGLRDLMRRTPNRPLTLLDVGSGSGSTAVIARKEAKRARIDLTFIGLDVNPRLARLASRDGHGICGTALALPFATASVDVVLGSLLLHHFEGTELMALIREMDRVARCGVVVHDLRRSRIAAAGLWALSFPLAFHRVSRHDGVTSVRRGFTVEDLRGAIKDAVGMPPVVTKRMGYRLLASWIPTRTALHGAREAE
jgi:hypothetical protein